MKQEDQNNQGDKEKSIFIIKIENNEWYPYIWLYQILWNIREITFRRNR